MRSRRRKILITVGLMMLVGAGVAVWPSGLGGATTYVSTVGSSMEPTVHHDDLVLVRPVAHYDIGDVVAYRSEVLDTVVLHRIVDRDGDRYILQGDNNTWLDRDQPVQAEIIGHAWLTVPHGGRALGLLRTATPVLAALFVLATGAGTARRRNRARNLPKMQPPTSTRRSTRLWRNATVTLAATAGASLLVGLVAFNRPTTASSTETLDYAHRAELRYAAAAPPGPVYEDGQVRTGEPVFLSLVRQIAIEFAYQLDADDVGSATGTIGLHTEIEGTNGWRHDLVLSEPSEFHGSSATARADLDIAQIQSIIDQVETLTGVASSVYDVTIVPHVTVDATLGGEPLDDHVDPRFSFQLDAHQLRLTQPAVDDTDNPTGLVAPVTEGTLTRATESSASLVFARWVVAVSAARWAATAVGALATIGALVGAMVLRRRLRSEVARIELQYGDRLVVIADGGEERGRLIVDVTTMHDLARLAEQHDTLILHHRTENRSFYFFELEGRMYRYTERRLHRFQTAVS